MAVTGSVFFDLRNMKKQTNHIPLDTAYWQTTLLSMHLCSTLHLVVLLPPAGLLFLGVAEGCLS